MSRKMERQGIGMSIRYALKWRISGKCLGDLCMYYPMFGSREGYRWTETREDHEKRWKKWDKIIIVSGKAGNGMEKESLDPRSMR